MAGPMTAQRNPSLDCQGQIGGVSFPLTHLAICLRMIFSENRFPLFRIMLQEIET
jgi:hypothetical protein